MRSATERTPAWRASLLVLAALLLGGCGGEEEIPVDVSGFEGGGAYTGDVPLLEGEDCDVEVVVTGDASVAWDGPGVVATDDASGAPAVYQAAYDESVLTIYAAEPPAEPRITLDVAGDVY
ncbi:MAG: hypothetical protein WKF79_13540, partial [Nocardioides sp.]